MQLGLKQLMMPLISFLSYGTWQFKEAYNIIYQGQNKSRQFVKIVKDAFGDEFPEDTESYSFVTLTDLNKMADFSNLEEGDCFADIACGRGGPGMWLARKTNTKILGMDISEEAVNSANQRIHEFGLDDRAEFKTGTFYDTGFENESCDCAISVDALWLAPDRNKALVEIARILKPNARFIFTTWDGNIPFMPSDHKGSLADSGFEVEIYEETKGWKKRQLAVYNGVLNSEKILIEEMGRKYAMPIIKEAKSAPPFLDKSTRIFVVAKKI